jgi:hypothetical protein
MSSRRVTRGEYLAMDKNRDLLPWIFGGLSMATAAMAITLGSTYGNAPGHAPNNSQAPSPITAHTPPEAEAPTAPVLAPASVPAPAPTAVPAQTLVAAQIQTVAPPVEPSSQIWECTINGQKTFSDNPCGDKSALREIGPINRMDPTPILPHARASVPESSYQAEYSNPGEQVDSYPGDQQFGYNSYPVFIGNPFHERRRPDHGHRPHGHDRGPQPPDAAAMGLPRHPGIRRQ